MSTDAVYLPAHRIALRGMRISDLDCYRAAQQPGKRWQDLDGPYFPRPDQAEIDVAIDRLRQRIERGSGSAAPPRMLAIASLSSDELVGLVTWSWESEETHWPLVGIVLFDEDMWGLGLGYEALGTWCEYLFTQLPSIVRLDLRTWSGNFGMMRLAEKLGFQEEARFRKARIVSDAYFDGMGYGILREEWAERYPQGFLVQLDASLPGR